MQLYFSNVKLWGILTVICAVLAVMFFFLFVALLKFWLVALLVLLVVGLFAVLAYKLYQLPERRYIEIWDGSFTISGVFRQKVTTFNLSDVRHTQHLGHQLRFIFSDARVTYVHLNFLSSEDIKKLLLFLKYVPSSGKKMI